MSVLIPLNHVNRLCFIPFKLARVCVTKRTILWGKVRKASANTSNMALNAENRLITPCFQPVSVCIVCVQQD